MIRRKRVRTIADGPTPEQNDELTQVARYTMGELLRRYEYIGRLTRELEEVRVRRAAAGEIAVFTTPRGR